MKRKIKSIELFMDESNYFYAKSDSEFIEFPDKSIHGIPIDVDNYLEKFFGVEYEEE